MIFLSLFNQNSAKRTVDFGLGRGLSGAIEAKHRLGMAAANFAGEILFNQLFCSTESVGFGHFIAILCYSIDFDH